eukprot:TRINITY_DN4243_c0_g1_i1.p1 TRINITY_DN4243_c0_g1~~TRINITY_DN4243_c0_g1_i1.p1  ORF type:complete len:946 (+),score=137.53 TRINITY_DN4243_c0_g1_i1:93-2930(+)
MLSHCVDRFSLYCLEDGEEHIEDVLGDYRYMNWSFKAKIRLCTRSMFFDSDDITDPIIRLHYGSILGVGTSGMKDEILIRGKQITTMLKNGIIGGHEKIDTPAEESHKIKLHWEQPETFSEKLQHLIAAHSNGTSNVVKRPAFDFTWLGSVSETIAFQCNIVKQLPLRKIHGRIVLTTQAIYIQLFENISGQPITKIGYDDIQQCARREVFRKAIGVEIQHKDSNADTPPTTVTFESESDCDRFWKIATDNGVPITKDRTLDDLTARWVSHQISTYEYLMNLNWLAGRSLNNLSQYPVLPWVISDYSSSRLNLNDPAAYRDFRKPIGALNDSRLQAFKARMEEMPGDKYLYGTHYSTPSYVMYYVVRQKPEWMLLIQNGKFDKGGRLFNSIPQCWKNVTTLNNDVKELIPQFFQGDGGFLTSKGLDLGTLDDGSRVPDSVELPPWADSPDEFVSINRTALESLHVSANIHHWIDLVFGYQSRGDAARDADNLYHPFTYETADVSDESVRAQVQEFGQCPTQLFTKPHPKRDPEKGFNRTHCDVSGGLQPELVIEASPKKEQFDPMAGIGRAPTGVDDDLPVPVPLPDLLGSDPMLKVEERNEDVAVHDLSEILNIDKIDELAQAPRSPPKCRKIQALRTTIETMALKRPVSQIVYQKLTNTPEWVERMSPSCEELIFMAGGAGEVPIIDGKTGIRMRSVQLGSHTLLSIASSTTGMIGVSSLDDHIYRFCTTTGRLQDRTPTGMCSAVAITFNADSSQLVAGKDDGSVAVFNSTPTALVPTEVSFMEHQCSISDVCSSPINPWNIASAADDGIKLYDTRCFESGSVWQCGTESTTVHFFDSDRLVSANADTVDFIDLRTYSTVASTPHNIQGIGPALTSSGVVTVTGTNTVAEGVFGCSEFTVVHTFDDECELQAVALADERLFCAVQKSRHTHLHVLEADESVP